MASTVLEQLRAGQEAIESYERAVVSILNEKPRNHRERVVHGHKVSNLLDKVVEQSQHVHELYEDKDKTFEDETESMRGRAVFTSFYEQLKSIRAFHLKYPNTPVVHEPSLDEALHPDLQFSGEERFGKYVDLHEFYLRYLNLPAFKWSMDKYATKTATRSGSTGRRARRENGNRESEAVHVRVDYLTYLSCFHDFAVIPESEKCKAPEYQQYLVDLKTYVLEFYRKTQPLVDLDDVIAETRAKFDKQWALHSVPGWDQPHEDTERTGSQGSQPPPLFCTACDKQFTSEGVYTSHLKGKKHKKAVEAHTTNALSPTPDGSTSSNGGSEGSKIRAAIAFDEVLIRRLHELLTEVIHGTISYLEVKQTRTHDELQAEIAEEEEGAFSDVDIDNALEDHDDEDQPIYNPLNLPLGWDGKPIPYWLYKLHGLGIEFKCEICGNHSYWGRRDFDRHFQQWRHAHGMRCLGIPNTKHFHDITLISDAKALYEKLKDQIDAEVWNASNEEEFEDSEGNVLSRKTFEDLARQGLL